MENLNLSIGIIETTGYIATISALDTLLNASDVKVIDKELIGAGIVVIIIAGSISNIKEAVKSADMAVEKLNAKCRHAIIAKPHNDIWSIIP
ncbi:microcompartment protein [Brachyspira hampsonii]|uniref:Microcompartment protein n=1 Tax=Brachyspira hampsonii TaxID=1287055 RepID=A0A1E5NAD3_9SPIR|nr:BMC domain-containing protein [Brachyspira hampsonii]OEJ13037.1 microcompartment protein [Brachyspira hampsonii]